jgi:hypothetical protein
MSAGKGELICYMFVRFVIAVVVLDVILVEDRF